MRKTWNGFIENDGLSRLQIITEGKDFGVWIDGDFDDSIGTKRDFVEQYGGYKMFRSKVDYKKDKSLTLDEAIAEMVPYP